MTTATPVQANEGFRVLEHCMIRSMQLSAPRSADERLLAARKGAIDAICQHPALDRNGLRRLERIARGQDSGLVIAYLGGDRAQAAAIFDQLDA